MSKILDEPYLIGYVFKNGYHKGNNRIENTLESVADYICRNGMDGDITVTTPMDEFVLDTFGIYIDQCPDTEYLEQLKKVLIPKQMNLDGTSDQNTSHSVLFSKVELRSDDGFEYEYFVGGIPTEYDDLDSVCGDDLFMAFEGKTQIYRARVTSYLYGDGETEKADYEELSEIRGKFDNDEGWMSELTPLEDSEFTFEWNDDEECEEQEQSEDPVIDQMSY